MYSNYIWEVNRETFTALGWSGWNWRFFNRKECKEHKAEKSFTRIGSKGREFDKDKGGKGRDRHGFFYRRYR